MMLSQHTELYRVKQCGDPSSKYTEMFASNIKEVIEKIYTSSANLIFMCVTILDSNDNEYIYNIVRECGELKCSIEAMKASKEICEECCDTSLGERAYIIRYRGMEYLVIDYDIDSAHYNFYNRMSIVE